jgi:hypothetical protein
MGVNEVVCGRAGTVLRYVYLGSLAFRAPQGS